MYSITIHHNDDVDSILAAIQSMAQPLPGESSGDALQRRGLYRNAVLSILALGHAKPEYRKDLMAAVNNRLNSSGYAPGLESILFSLLTDPLIKAADGGLALEDYTLYATQAPDAGAFFYNYQSGRGSVLSPETLASFSQQNAQNNSSAVLSSSIAGGLEPLALQSFQSPFTNPPARTQEVTAGQVNAWGSGIWIVAGAVALGGVFLGAAGVAAGVVAVYEGTAAVLGIVAASAQYAATVQGGDATTATVQGDAPEGGTPAVSDGGTVSISGPIDDGGGGDGDGGSSDGGVGDGGSDDGNHHCFAAGTEILTVDKGLVPIENLHPGAWIRSADAFGRPANALVTSVHIWRNQQTQVLQFDNSFSLEVSIHQPLLGHSGARVRARAVEELDRLRTMRGGFIAVAANRQINGRAVYELELANQLSTAYVTHRYIQTDLRKN